MEPPDRRHRPDPRRHVRQPTSDPHLRPRPYPRRRLPPGLAGGLRRLLRRQRVEAELDEELRGFFAAAVEARVAAGMDEAHARRAARLELGSLEAVKEEVRRAGWEAALETLCQDVRFALRVLRRGPGATAAAILTLALGVGVNVAVFSLADSLLLRPLPVADPGRLLVLAFQKQQGPLQDNFSHALLADLREQTAGVFSGLMGFQYGVDGLGVPGGGAHRVLTSYVTGDYFLVLGIKPALGRLLLPAEGRTPGADPVVVLAWSCWRSRFGGDPAIVGRKVLLNGQPLTVAGVAPAGFHGARALLAAEAWLPLAMAIPLEGFSRDFLTHRGIRNLIAVARLRPGVDLARARSALRVAAARLARRYPATDRGMTLSAWPEIQARPTPGTGGRTTAIRRVAQIFLLLAALVLALACVNVANLLLVRAIAREGELVMRAALGAARRRLVRQLLTESLALALAGGAAGTLAGIACAAALGSSRPGASEYPLLDPAVDWRVLAYAAGAALATGFATGAAPALRVRGGDLAAALRGAGGRGLAGGRHRLYDALAAIQVGACLALLIAAGLFTRSLANTRRLDLGFDPDRVLNAGLDPGGAGFTEERGRALYRELLRRARALPGVESASLAASVPMGDNYFENTLLVPGYLSPAGQPAPILAYDMVSPGYFATLGIPLLAGRDFTDADRQDTLPVAVVSRTMAERFWPRPNPLGRRFALASRTAISYTVVGVAKDVRRSGAQGAPEPFFYLPLTQKYASWQVLQLRTGRPPRLLEPAVRRLIADLAPGVPVFDVGPMREALGGMRGFLVLRLGAGLATLLGFLGMAVAVVGLYGVVSYAAGLRRREIGLRMALGAGRAEVAAMMLRHGLRIVGAGVAGGLLAASGLARLIGGMLVGVSAADPRTWAAVTAALALVGLAASCLPAWRAAAVDPTQVLRGE
jgi:predicted permease